jgi:hypothetical protein
MNKLLTVLLVCCLAAIVWIMWVCSLDAEAKLRLSGMVAGAATRKRRKLMDGWATYCAKVETDAGKVVALARARTPR